MLISRLLCEGGRCRERCALMRDIVSQQRGEPLSSAAHHLFFVSEGKRRDGLVNLKPARLVDLVVVTAHVAADVTQQIKVNEFLKAHRLAAPAREITVFDL